jgi:hypothetical protein
MPLGDFPDARWQRVRSDIDQFLASALAENANALGWTDLDPYGVDVSRPYARIDQAGLVIMLDGCRIVEMTAETVILETTSTARQSFRRRGERAGQVLIWALLQRNGRV